jgi:hypothetical protein
MSTDKSTKYKQACTKIKEDNAKLLTDFEQWLSGKGIGKKMITEHVQTIDFYINTYLLQKVAIPARDGAGGVSMFLDCWFGRKTLWASAGLIGENATSLKKFFTFMQERGEIDADDLQEVRKTIKEKMDEWFALQLGNISP